MRASTVPYFALKLQNLKVGINFGCSLHTSALGGQQVSFCASQMVRERECNSLECRCQTLRESKCTFQQYLTIKNPKNSFVTDQLLGRHKPDGEEEGLLLSRD